MNIDDLIGKCVKGEKQTAATRNKPLSRFFVNLDTSTQRVIPKAVKAAPRWKISRIRMVAFDKKNDELLFSYVSCDCDFCLDGQFMSCKRWPLKMKKKITRAEIQTYFEVNSQPVETNHSLETQSQNPDLESQVASLADPDELVKLQEETTIVGLDPPKMTPELKANSIEVSDSDDSDNDEKSSNTHLNRQSIHTRRRKKKSDHIVTVPAQSFEISVFRNTFEDSKELLQSQLSVPLHTGIIEDFIVSLRSTFLRKKILLLSPCDIARVFGNRNESSESDRIETRSCQEITYEDLNALCDGDLSEINSVAGIFYSNPDLAKRKTFTIPWGRQKMGHFVFFTIDCQKSQAKIFDTYNDDFSNSEYFSRIQCSRFFSFFIQAKTYSFIDGKSRVRSIRNIDYEKTKFTQQGNECGVLACFNLVLFYDQTHDFIKLYSLDSPYATTIANIKTLIIYILLNQKLPAQTYSLE